MRPARRAAASTFGPTRTLLVSLDRHRDVDRVRRGGFVSVRRWMPLLVVLVASPVRADDAAPSRHHPIRLYGQAGIGFMTAPRYIRRYADPGFGFGGTLHTNQH